MINKRSWKQEKDQTEGHKSARNECQAAKHTSLQWSVNI